MTHPALKTSLCDMLHIEYPLIQAGMGFIARGELAAAVSQAGGLGMIGSASLSPDELRAEIRKVRARTDRPFGVDILFATTRSPAADVVTGQLTRSVQAHVDVVFEERVPVLASGLGDPGPIVDQAHDLGMTVIALVGNTRNARRVEASGVDIVVAQGYDGGGHTGRVGTLSLLPAVIDAVDIPVMAAGGIGDGRGIAAAIALGASGAQIGTAYLLTSETTISPLQPDSATSLVHKGVFGRTRNPMYVGLFLVLLAWAVWLQAISNTIVLLAFVLWLTEMQIKPEEAALRKVFGQGYVDYCKRVRRWI